MALGTTVKKEGVNVIKWGLVIAIGIAVFVPLVNWVVGKVKGMFTKSSTETAA